MVYYNTDYPADSVEFCPMSGFQDLFVCGTYKLVKDEDGSNHEVSEAKTQKRVGKCLLMRTSDTTDNLTLLQEIDMSAILDMKWSTTDATLSVAESEGRIRLFRLSADNMLTDVQTMQLRTTETLCLSLDCSNRRDGGPGSIIASWSDGTLSLLGRNSDGSLEENRSWHAHDYEPWIAAWNYWDTNVVYSGGDDMKLNAWDVRQESPSPIFTNRRFEAGVTTIQCHPHVEHIIAVGCYDSTVRIIDVRKPQMPVVTADVGGGAWRVKWHPSGTRRTDLLVACMHDGFKVVRFSPSIVGSQGNSGTSADTDVQEWQIVKRFDKHTSLAYGVDWSYAHTQDDTGSIIASCSFYDHTLHTWRG